MAQVKPLHELPHATLQRLKIRWEYEALKVERTIETETNRLLRMEHRTKLLLAARNALTYLHNTAQQILEVLQGSGALPELVAEQQAVVHKYADKLGSLPGWSNTVPGPARMQLLNLNLDDIAAKKELLVARVQEINELLAG